MFRWIEFWQRKKRQYFCSAQTWEDITFGHSIYSPFMMKPTCNDIDDDLREIKCSNKNDQQLIEVCKFEK